MASKYTSVVYIQGNSRRRYRGYVSATVTNTSATQCRVDWYASVEMYNAAQYGVAVTCTVDGTQRGSDEGYLSSSPGTTYKTVASTSGSTTFSRGSSSRSVSVAVRAYGKTVSGYGSAGGSASASVSVTIPAINYDAPASPSSCSASRASDAQAKVTWVNGSTTTTTPRSATLVERQTDEGSWVQVASVGASVTSYTDNGISANHRYAYRVRASGAGGYSGYATSGYVYTTPAAPSYVNLTKTSGTEVSVGVDVSSAPYATSWEVQESLNGGDWAAVGSFDTFPQTVDVGGGTAKLRARSVRDGLYSEWTESGTITTIVAPNAPTITTKPASVVPTDSVLAVAWAPNHPDGSAQSAAQVGYVVDDGPEMGAYVAGAISTYTLPASVSASACAVKVRVRTKGIAEDWGAWSSYYAFAVAVPPEAHFTSPGVDGARIGDLPLNVEWDVTDSTGVAEQTLQLLDASGAVIHTTSPAPGVREYQLGAGTYQLANATAYGLRLTVRGGSTLSSTAVRDFATNFAEPSRPSADVSLDPDSLSEAITVYTGPDTSDEAEVLQVEATPGTLVPGLTVYGATRQNLWVNPSGTSNGVTVTANDDGSVTISGTSTAAAAKNENAYVLRPSTEYVLSISADSSPANFNVVFTGGETPGGYKQYNATTAGKTFTTPASWEQCIFQFSTPAGQTVSGTYRIMLNEGSEPEPWCPPGLNGVGELEVVTAGKNLIPMTAGSSSSGVTSVVNGDGSVTLSGTSTSSQAIAVASSGNVTTLNGLAGRIICMRQPDSDSVYLQLNVKRRDLSQEVALIPRDGTSAVIPDGVEYAILFIGVMPLADTDVTVYPQVEIGSTPTAYEPPAVTSTPIDLDGHALNSLPDGTRDELRVDGTGAVTLVKRTQTVKLGGGKNWVRYESPFVHYQSSWSNYNGESTGVAYTNLLCDKLPVGNAGQNRLYSANVGGSTAFLREPTFADDAAGVKTWMDSNIPTVITPLATPQEVELPGISMPSFPADPSTLFAASDVPCAVQVDYPATSSLTVQRVAPDGSIWTVADGLLSGQQAIDPLPPLNVPVDYVVTAHTSAGATSEVRVTETLRALVGAFNFGPAAGTCVLARLDPDWSHDVARSGTLYHFADGGEGGGLPVAYGGQDVDATRSMGFALLDTEQLRRLQALAREHFVCWYRDPYGGRALCSVSWSFSSGIPYDLLKVSASMTETVFEEAW